MTVTADMGGQPQLIQGSALPEWTLDCSFVEDNVAALALGALDPEERIRADHHLSWCPSCARLVHQTRKTVGYLPFLSPHAAPSASAKSSLLSKLALTPQLPGSNPDPSFDVSAITPTATVATSLITDKGVLRTRADASSRRLKWELWAAPLAAVPLVVALAIVGGWAMQTQDRLQDRSAEVRNLEVVNDSLEAQLVTFTKELDAPGATEHALQAADISGAAKPSGSIRMSADKLLARVTVTGLPSFSSGYQVIAESKDGTLLPAGHLIVDKSGSGTVNLKLDRPLTDVESIHIQPAGLTSTSTANLTSDDLLWIEIDQTQP